LQTQSPRPPQNTKIPNFLATVILSHFLLPAVVTTTPSKLKYPKFLGAYNNKAVLSKVKTEAMINIHGIGFAKKLIYIFVSRDARLARRQKGE
jgi:hypothetical protein